MAWQLELSDAALKDLAKLDKPVAKRIIDFLRQRVNTLEDPRAIGQALTGARLGAYWKYRVGDYRVIARIEDDILRVFVIHAGHRRHVYRD